MDPIDLDVGVRPVSSIQYGLGLIVWASETLVYIVHHGTNSKVEVFEVESGKSLSTHHYPFFISKAEVSPDGERVVFWSGEPRFFCGPFDRVAPFEGSVDLVRWLDERAFCMHSDVNVDALQIWDKVSDPLTILVDRRILLTDPSVVHDDSHDDLRFADAVVVGDRVVAAWRFVGKLTMWSRKGEVLRSVDLAHPAFSLLRLTSCLLALRVTDEGQTHVDAFDYGLDADTITPFPHQTSLPSADPRTYDRLALTNASVLVGQVVRAYLRRVADALRGYFHPVEQRKDGRWRGALTLFLEADMDWRVNAAVVTRRAIVTHDYRLHDENAHVVKYLILNVTRRNWKLEIRARDAFQRIGDSTTPFDEAMGAEVALANSPHLDMSYRDYQEPLPVYDRRPAEIDFFYFYTKLTNGNRFITTSDTCHTVWEVTSRDRDHTLSIVGRFRLMASATFWAGTHVFGHGIGYELGSKNEYASIVEKLPIPKGVTGLVAAYLATDPKSHTHA